MNSRRIAIARILGLGLCAVSIDRWVLAAERLPRIGALLPRGDVDSYLREELGQLGYQEGRTAAFDWRRYNDWGAEMRALRPHISTSSSRTVLPQRVR